MSKLDDILDKIGDICHEKYVGAYKREDKYDEWMYAYEDEDKYDEWMYAYEDEVVNMLQYPRVKQQLKDLMLAIIGEDVELLDKDEIYSKQNAPIRADGYNIAKAQLRKQVQDL